MSAEKQTVLVQGDQSQVLTAGRDLVMAETYVQQKPDFFEPNLEQFKPPTFISPRITPQLIEILRKQRLLVLGGSHEVDKPALARHLAWCLGEVLWRESGNGRVPVWEWYRSSSDPQSVGLKLRETDKATIFVLPQVSPQDVSYDLGSIHEAAVGAKHFVVVGTDTPFASWKLPEDAKTLYWQDLSPAELYGPQDLANVLIQRLIDAQESLPSGFLDDTPAPDRPLVGGLLIGDAAQRLRTPGNISVFVQLLCARKEPPQEAEVLQIIELAQDNKRTLGQWYHTLLDPREQLLALGLSFFDGVFDDQFFAALERVVENVWQRRDASLRALDYCDLDDLRNFFSFVEVENRGTLIEGRFPEQRRMLFEVAWNSHRRQILTALPVLAQLVVNSVAARSYHTELYGTYARRDQLRKVVGETLSDIGLISVAAVQDTLLQLAADREIGVQAVTARALARWRYYGRDDELFATLQRWQREAQFAGLIGAILKGREEEETESPQAYIRATVALTLGYAAQYDPPNALSQELYDLLGELTEDQNRLVRNRFRTHTLLLVVPLHLVQLRDALRSMVRYTDLIPAVAASLARTYSQNPDEVVKTLDSWRDECRKTKPEKVNQKVITLREALLATVAMTYGYIQYGEGVGPLTVSKGLRQLQSILSEETHRFVRTTIVLAITHMARRNFERVEPMLQSLMAEVTEEERNEIVRNLTDLYLEQRENQEDGDDVIEVNGRRYPIWSEHWHPPTEVETRMYRWIKDANHPAAQQVAAKASVEFARALDIAEARRIKEIKEERKRKEEAVDEGLPLILRTPRRTIVHQLASWLATLNAADYRSVILGLLPEVSVQNRTRRDAMRFVLDKWRLASDDQIKKIAAYLGRALSWAQNGWILVMIIIGLTLCGMCTFWSLISSIFD